MTITFDFSTYIDEHARDFTGREWVFAEIDDWLADPRGPVYFIVTGEPGIGKTAIAARLTQVNDIAAYHFCIARRSNIIDPLNFARSISHQLTRIDGFAQGILKDSDIHLEAQQSIQEVYGQAINIKIENLIANAPSATIAFTHLVIEPLRALYNGSFDKQIVILVDALDEAVQQVGAETIVDLLANAGKLPNSVRFVLTSRPDGAVLRHFQERDIPHLMLNAGREENQTDIRTYIRERLAVSTGLRSRIEGVNTDIFLEKLSVASKGNFLYVVWVLQGIAEGTQEINRLDAMPVGLDGIYREFLRTRKVGRDMDKWENRHRPIIGTLAAAQVPLTKEQLSKLTGLDRQAVGDSLRDIKQFLDPIQAEQGIYQLYHQSVIDFFNDEVGAEEFWIDLKIVHRHIADYYLQTWGGLENGLPGLQETEKRNIDNGFGLHYLTIHLRMADRVADLHNLLRLQRQVGDWYENVWYGVKEATGDMAGYLADIERAWHLAENAFAVGQSPEAMGLQCRYALITTSINSLAQNIPPVLIASLVDKGAWMPVQGLAYARQIPSATQRTESLAGLLPYLSEAERDEVIKEVLLSMRDIDKEEAKTSVLAVTILYLPGTLLEEIQLIIGEIRDTDSRACLLAGLAIRTVKLERTVKGLEILQEIKIEHWQAKALVELSFDLPASYIDRALEIALAMKGRENRVRVLISLIPHLPEPLKEKALQQGIRTADGMLFEKARAAALASLTPYMEGLTKSEMLQNILEETWKINDENLRVEVLARLTPYLSEPEQNKITDQLLAISQKIGEEDVRWVLEKVAPYLIVLGHPDEMLAVANKIGDKPNRIRVLVPLLSYFSEPTQIRILKDALVDVDAIESRQIQIELLMTLLPNAPESIKHEISVKILAGIQLINDIQIKDIVLTTVIPHLPKPLLQNTLGMMRVIGDDESRKYASANMESYSNEPIHSIDIAEKRDTISKENGQIYSLELENRFAEIGIPDYEEFNWIGEPTRLASKLAESENIEETLKVILDLAKINVPLPISKVEAKAPKRSLERDIPPFKSQMQVDLLNKILKEWEQYNWGGHDILKLMGKIFKHKPTETLVYLILQPLECSKVVVTQAMRSASLQVVRSYENTDEDFSIYKGEEYSKDRKKVKSWSKDDQLEAIAVLVWTASHLPESLKEAALREIVTATLMISDKIKRVNILVALIPHLPDRLRAQVLAEALTAAQALTNENRNSQVDVLVKIALYLPEPLRNDVLRQALSVTQKLDVKERISMLIWLAPYLSESLKLDALQEAWATVRAIGDAVERVGILTRLSSYLPESQKDMALREAWDATRTIGDVKKRVETIIWLLPYLPVSLKAVSLPEALESAQLLEPAGERVKALLDLSYHLSEELKNKTLQDALATARMVSNPKERVEILVWLASYLPAPLKSKTLQEASLAAAMTIVDKTNQAVVLAWLDSYLSHPLNVDALTGALTAVQEIANNQSRMEVLMMLVPRLKGPVKSETLEQALDTARKIEDAKKQAESLIQLSFHLPESSRIDALLGSLEAVRQVKNTREQAQLLRWLSDRLPYPLKDEILHEANLAAVLTITDEEKRVKMLAWLAFRLPDSLRNVSIQKAMAVAHETADVNWKIAILARLAPHLTGSFWQEALLMVREIEPKPIQVKAMIELVPYLSVSQSVDILRDATLATLSIIENVSERERSMIELLPHLAHLPWDSFCSLWFEALHTTAVHTRQELLRDLCDLAPVIGTRSSITALQETTCAIQDVGRWWP